ncbi:unnamed protein product [Urochloa humidicola]
MSPERPMAPLRRSSTGASPLLPAFHGPHTSRRPGHGHSIVVWPLVILCNGYKCNFIQCTYAYGFILVFCSQRKHSY